MSFESLKHEAVGKFLSAFPASLESLKREALKNLLKNTGMLAEVVFCRYSGSLQEILHFASLRSDLLYKVKRFFVIFQCVC